jgi:hypothetical protein
MFAEIRRTLLRVLNIVGRRQRPGRRVDGDGDGGTGGHGPAVLRHRLFVPPRLAAAG